MFKPQVVQCSRNKLSIIHLSPAARLDRVLCISTGNDEDPAILGGACVLDMERSCQTLAHTSAEVRLQLHSLNLRHSLVTQALSDFRDLNMLACTFGPCGSISLAQHVQCCRAAMHG